MSLHLTAHSSLLRALKSPSNMPLLHQSGSVKIGEVIRYTITYTPSQDRAIPLPSILYLKIRNNCSAPLRAAYLRGPYNLSVAAYPATYNPNEDFKDNDSLGVPCFEPNLRAGASWDCILKVPEKLRTLVEGQKTGLSNSQHVEGMTETVSWIVEVASQVIFSASVAVHFEVLLGRYEKLLSQENLSAHRHPKWSYSLHTHNHHHISEVNDQESAAYRIGVFSKAIELKVEDTATLWNKPSFPELNEALKDINRSAKEPHEFAKNEEEIKVSTPKRLRRFHLVVLTHGLHSNLGADMLYLKESIDAAARQSRINAKKLRRQRRAKKCNEINMGGPPSNNTRFNDKTTRPLPDQPQSDEEDESGEDEGEEEGEVIVRGFPGNAARTERGIKYLGKRLARYVLSMIYPDYHFPSNRKRNVTHTLSHAMNADSCQYPEYKTNLDQQKEKRMYIFTSISFIGHSLGGLVQTYAVAYIQKHWPEFFEKIRPINFITLATPFLGLSNENPLYVKFALDFGLIGRTGQDLGLTWLAPTLAKRSWGAFIGGISDNTSKTKDQNEQCRSKSKPLLQILPMGPAHVALKKFKKRTIYSNVVNDGIVPLRTSCLLFVDWHGLGRVEKARRGNSPMGNVAEWGWAEITGANSAGASTSKTEVMSSELNCNHDEKKELLVNESSNSSTINLGEEENKNESEDIDTGGTGIFSNLIKIVQPSRSCSKVNQPKTPKIYLQSQTREVKIDTNFPTPSGSSRALSVNPLNSLSIPNINLLSSPQTPNNNLLRSPQTPNNNLLRSPQTPNNNLLRSPQTLNNNLLRSPQTPNNNLLRYPQTPNLNLSIEDLENYFTPPRTSIFESAGDLLNPPLPPIEYFLELSSRPETIFHDRIYYPSDIPPPRQEKRQYWKPHSPRIFLSSSEHTWRRNNHDPRLITQTCLDEEDLQEAPDSSSMKIEEKIARAYHDGLSWRKVLVRLEPEAHNNIFVRRMFANAYGWPVVKHLCDAHFSESAITWSHVEDYPAHQNISSESNDTEACYESIDSRIEWDNHEAVESGSESED